MSLVCYYLSMGNYLVRDLIEQDSETDSTELCIYVYDFIYNDLNNGNTELDKR